MCLTNSFYLWKAKKMFLNIDKQNLLVKQCLLWKPNIQTYLTSKISNVCQTRLVGAQNSGYTCDFLLVMATRHCQICSATKVEGGYRCSQVSLMMQKVQFDEILQHCLVKFVSKPALGYTCNILVSQSLQVKKEVLY